MCLPHNALHFPGREVVSLQGSLDTIPSREVVSFQGSLDTIPSREVVSLQGSLDTYLDPVSFQSRFIIMEQFHIRLCYVLLVQLVFITNLVSVMNLK